MPLALVPVSPGPETAGHLLWSSVCVETLRPVSGSRSRVATGLVQASVRVQGEPGRVQPRPGLQCGRRQAGRTGGAPQGRAGPGSRGRRDLRTATLHPLAASQPCTQSTYEREGRPPRKGPAPRPAAADLPPRGLWRCPTRPCGKEWQIIGLLSYYKTRGLSRNELPEPEATERR